MQCSRDRAFPHLDKRLLELPRVARGVEKRMRVPIGGKLCFQCRDFVDSSSLRHCVSRNRRQLRLGCYSLGHRSPAPHHARSDRYCLCPRPKRKHTFPLAGISDDRSGHRLGRLLYLWCRSRAPSPTLAVPGQRGIPRGSTHMVRVGLRQGRRRPACGRSGTQDPNLCRLLTSACSTAHPHEPRA